MNPRSRFKFFAIRTGLALLLAIAVVINAVDEIQPAPVEADARQHLTMAYNIFQYGVISDVTTDQPGIPPTYRREPLYPIVLAGVLKIIADPETLRLNCLLDAEPDCQSVQAKLQGFNLGLLLALVFATFLAARIVMGGAIAPWLAALLVGVSPALVDAVHSFYTEIPAALALLIGSTSLYLTASKSRWLGAAIAAGVAFGALMLIKAVFFYFGVILALGIFVLVKWQRVRHLLRAGLVTLLVAYAIAGIWMTRNFVQFGTAAIAGRSGEILAIRAEFSTMTWREYGASFLAYTPNYGEPLLQQFFQPQDYERFDRENPNGFYRRAKDRYAAMSQSPTIYSTVDAQLETDSISLIRQNWLKHLALTATFAYRGAFLKLVPENSLVPTRLFYIGSMLIVLGWALGQGHVSLLLFLLPSLYSYGIHAVATHYIPRYSEPLIPCLAIAFVLLFASCKDGLRQFRRVGPWAKP